MILFRLTKAILLKIIDYSWTLSQWNVVEKQWFLVHEFSEILDITVISLIELEAVIASTPLITATLWRVLGNGMRNDLIFWMEQQMSVSGETMQNRDQWEHGGHGLSTSATCSSYCNHMKLISLLCASRHSVCTLTKKYRHITWADTTMSRVIS